MRIKRRSNVAVVRTLQRGSERPVFVCVGHQKQNQERRTAARSFDVPLSPFLLSFRGRDTTVLHGGVGCLVRAQEVV